MEFIRNKEVQVGTAAVAGVGAGAFMLLTGPSVALHEVVGHGYLGFRLTHSYPPGEGPTYQVDGYDNFKAIFSSKNLTEKVKNVGLWLTGYDRHQDGAAGWCSGGYGRVNGLGQAMGSHGRRAWVSVAGSLPALGIDSVMVASAVQMRHSHPKLAAFMGAYASYDHLVNCAYPLTAAIMNTAKLEEAAAKGHDFASVAIHISAMTGISAVVVARLTFFAWLGFVPLVALVSYWHERSHMDSLISDEEAVFYFTQSWNLNSELNNIYTQFRQSHQPDIENGYTYAYLREHLDLRAIKQHMLNQVRASVEVDLVEKCLSRLSTGASFVSMTSRLVAVLAETAYPALKPLASVLKIAAPVMQTLTMAQAFYHAKKDLSVQGQEGSALIKTLSVARAVCVALTSLGILASPWMSERKWILPVSIVGSMILPAGFDYLRAQAIRKKVEVEVGPVRSWSSCLSHGAFLGSLMVRIVENLARRYCPALKVAVFALHALSVAQEFYKTKQELKAERSSEVAKALSVARASSVALTSLGMVVSQFSSRLRWLLLPSLVGSMVWPRGFEYGRTRVLG